MSKSTQKRECIFVLGMHRSGTSAISGVLQQLGAEFGKDLVPPSYDNPKGFFENQKILDLNESILTELDIQWDYPGYLEEGWLELSKILKYLPLAQKIIKQQFGKSTVFVIKDPRICHLFPFWEKCLQDLGIKVSCILTWRNPFSVVKSLRRRNNLKENHSHILLSSYFTTAELQTRSTKRIFLNYSGLLANPKKVISNLSKTIGFPAKVDAAKLKKVSSFLSTKLRHHVPAKNEKLAYHVLHLQELYKIFNKASISGSATNSQKNAIDKYRTEHKNLTATFYTGVIGNKELFCKIFVDSGKGFNEGETTSFPVNSKLHSWDIADLAQYGKIQKIRILPVNTPAKLVLQYLGVDDDIAQAYKISSNAYHQDGSTYYFDNPHSEIIINFDNPYIANKLVLTLKYLELGEAVFPAIKDLDYGRMLKAKDLDLESKEQIIQERDRHVQGKEDQLKELEGIVKSYKNAIEAEKKEREKVVAELTRSIEAEKKDKLKLKESLLKAVEAEKLDKKKLTENLQKAILAEKEDKAKLKDSLLKSVNAEKIDKEKVKESLLKAIAAEKDDKAKLKDALMKSVNAEKIDKEKVKESLLKAIAAEKDDKAKLKDALMKSVAAEKDDKAKLKDALMKSVAAEKVDKEKVKESLLKAVAAEKEDKAKLKESLVQSINAEKLDKEKVKESLLKAIAAEREEKSKVKENLLHAFTKERNSLHKNKEALRQSMQDAINAEKEEREKLKESLMQALAAEKEDKHKVVESMLKAIEAEKADKEHIRTSLLERLNTEIENERRIRDERIGEATGLLYSEIKDKEGKINTLRDAIQHEINEKNKVVHELKDERQRVVTELISSVNHEIRERDRAVVRLQQAIQHEKAEQVRMFSELANSFSFKLGWFLTAPLRVTFNFLSGLKTGKVGMAFQMAGLALKNPAITLKALNPEKIRTFHSALKRESPETITSNFDKYLNSDKIKQAQATGQLAQKAVFESVPEKNPSDLGAISKVTTIDIPSTNGRSTSENPDSKSIESNQESLANLDTHSREEIHPVEADTKAAVIAQPTIPILPKKILFISPNIPDFDTSSGGKRATRMLGLLAEENEVYAYARGARQQKYIDKLASLDVTFLEEYDYDIIKAQLPELDVIIYAWYYTYHESIKFKDLYPRAKLIMDSVDIHWVREARSIGLMKGLTQKKADENKLSEIASYKSGDVVWAVTEPDRQAVLKEIPDVDVRVVSNIHEAAFEKYYPTETNNILFFGGYNHYPNISAVKIIAEEILPQVRQTVPDAVLLIAGANAPQEVIELGELDGVVYLGFIEEEDVEKLYESSIVTVAPLMAGAGIKGKICEAIAFMTPVITNAIGNEGIALIDGEEAFVTEDIPMMAQRIIECMTGVHDLPTLAKKAQIKLHKIVGPEIVKENMIDSLTREVSVCIVTWNRLELLKPCIDSILENTNYPYYKILVHSNGCEDGTQAYLKEIAETNPRIVPILSDKNDVFVIPNNQMADMLPHNDVVLINNDVTVEANWLQALVDAAYSSRKIGISGSKILYPDGTLQEFGSELYGNGSGRNIGKWDKEPYKEEYSKMTAVGYVSGCSLFIKRETLRKTGLFDMQFHPCYCEDSDLCYSAWKKDIYTVVTPHSVINHFEGGTSGKDEDSGFKSYQKINFDKFLAKHKKDLDKIAGKISEINKELHQKEFI